MKGPSVTKIHIAKEIVEDERLLANKGIRSAVEVTPGTSDDGKQLYTLLAQSKENGIKVEEIIADKAYSGKENLAEMKKEGIQPVVPLHPIVHSGGERQEGFD